jgi:hypothetical protein
VRLFPGGEGTSSVELLVVAEAVGVGALCPAARGLVELVGKTLVANGDGYGLGVEEGYLDPADNGRVEPRGESCAACRFTGCSVLRSSRQFRFDVATLEDRQDAS